MADDVNLSSPSGIAAADEISSKLYQKIKAGWGADGTWNETDTTTGKPYPIQLRGSDGTDRSNLMPVSVSSIAAGDNNIGNVDIVSMPALAAGTANIGDVDIASIAAGDNNIGNVDVLTLPAIPAGTNNIGDVDVLTLPPLPVGTNNIGDVDVLTLPALPAGTNNIGDVDVLTLPALPTGTNNIGDVDVLTVITGTGATNLGKAVDAVAGAADTGVAVLAIRDDALTTLTPIDGDYTPLRVSSTGALHVTGSSAATQYTEDVAAVADPIGDILMAVRKDTLSTSEVSADGDNIALKATNKGKLHVAAEMRFSDTVADVGTGTGGTATQRVVIDSAQMGTLGQTTMAASVPVVLASNQTTHPVSISTVGQTTASASVPVVPASDYVAPMYALTSNFVSGAITTAMTGTTSTSLVAAAGSSLRNYITTIIVSNAHATVGTDVVIQDGNDGTVLLTIPAAAVYGGAVITLPTPLRQPTTNTAIYCKNITTGASTKVSAVGYKAA